MKLATQGIPHDNLAPPCAHDMQHSMHNLARADIPGWIPKTTPRTTSERSPNRIRMQSRSRNQLNDRPVYSSVDFECHPEYAATPSVFRVFQQASL